MPKRIRAGQKARIIRSDPGGPHSNAADSVGPQLSMLWGPIWVHSWLLERFSGADPGGPTFGQLISRGYFWADPGRSSFWAGSWGAHFSGADAQRPEKVASDPARPKVEAPILRDPIGGGPIFRDPNLDPGRPTPLYLYVSGCERGVHSRGYRP